MFLRYHGIHGVLWHNRSPYRYFTVQSPHSECECAHSVKWLDLTELSDAGGEARCVEVPQCGPHGSEPWGHLYQHHPRETTGVSSTGGALHVDSGSVHFHFLLKLSAKESRQINVLFPSYSGMFLFLESLCCVYFTAYWTLEGNSWRQFGHICQAACEEGQPYGEEFNSRHSFMFFNCILRPDVRIKKKQWWKFWGLKWT